VTIRLNIVTCPTYPDKFIRDYVVAPSVLVSIVIVTLPRRDWAVECACSSCTLSTLTAHIHCDNDDGFQWKLWSLRCRFVAAVRRLAIQTTHRPTNQQSVVVTRQLRCSRFRCPLDQLNNLRSAFTAARLPIVGGRCRCPAAHRATD